MKPAFIIYAKRTPIGRLNGKLTHVRPDDMLSYLFKDFIDQKLFDPTLIDDVISGCANQAGEDNRNISRMAAVLAGIPYEVPGTTINRLCASSLDSIVDAMGRISMGLSDCVLVGGVESMTRAPYALAKPSTAFGRDSKLYDTTFGWRFPNKKMKEMFPLWSMGETAEEVAKIYKIDRESQDKFALESHQKATKAQEGNKFKDEILPLHVQLRKEAFDVTQDEGPRKDTNLEKLGKLKPVFQSDGTITAGNASSMNDGAACVCIVSEDFLKKHNLTPLLEVTGAGVRGVHPNTMGLGPIESTKVLMNRFNKKIDQFDVVELNEAFAAQAIACIQGLQIDPSKVNLNGGAIALGHPLGCSGARIVTTLTHIMKNDKSLKEGLATMCVGVGQGVSLSVKNV